MYSLNPPRQLSAVERDFYDFLDVIAQRMPLSSPEERQAWRQLIAELRARNALGSTSAVTVTQLEDR